MLIAARPVTLFGVKYAANDPVRASLPRRKLDQLLAQRTLVMTEAPLPPQSEALHILGEPARAEEARAAAEDPLEQAKRGEIAALTDPAEEDRPRRSRKA